MADLADAQFADAHLSDVELSWPVVESAQVYAGRIIAVRRETVLGPDGDTFVRDLVDHPGAVVILAVDDADRVLVVTQYRHPVGQRMVELPAGLLDKQGEDRLEAAKRELAEEGLTQAVTWSRLLDLTPSPGMSNERLTVYLAEDVSPAELPAGFVAEHEESSMTRDWVPLADLVAAALSGRIKNGAAVAGVLALWARRR